MAQASKTVELSVPPALFLEIIVDFESYPDFLEGVRSVKVKNRDAHRAQVEYSIELLGKSILYTLDHEMFGSAESEQGMRWSLVDSNVFKSNLGEWKLKGLGRDRTEVTYTLDLEFKIYVPSLILNALVKSSLPKMMADFEKQALKKAGAATHAR